MFQAGYVGTSEGTGLSNWMLNHNKRYARKERKLLTPIDSLGVVVLEEFEKLGDAAKEALLHPFESGQKR